MYFNKIPKWFQKLYKSYIWRMPAVNEKPTVYLTFDDGPHPEITPWVLEILEQYDVKATFFCIGKNVVEFPNVFKSIIESGHAIGNHTHNHLNGWKVDLKEYVENVKRAEQFINSKLFRPPYGKLKHHQASALKKMGFNVVLWTVIPGDWDHSISKEKCLENIVFNIEPGDIVVLHDSEKAKENMEYVLPRFLEFCKNNEWNVAAIN